MTILVTALTSERIATRLADLLMEGEHHLPVHAAGAFEHSPPQWRFEAWFADAPDQGDLALVADALLGPDAAGLRFEVRVLDDTDWVAKSLEDLPPVRVGRFVVHGAHDRHKRRANEIALEIEASLAFGTGHHGTTRGCLAVLDRLAARRAVTRRRGPARAGRPDGLLDVGTGTGVLAIAWAKARKAAPVATDLDAEAVRIARENARLAGVALSVRHTAELGGAAVRARAPYPVIVANILMGPLIALAGPIARLHAPGGALVLSGLLAWQQRAVERAYFARGYRIERRRLLGEWATLLLRAPGQARPRAGLRRKKSRSGRGRTG